MNAYAALVTVIGLILLGAVVVIVCSYFCFRKWRNGKRLPPVLMVFRRSRSYDQEVPQTPSSIQMEPAYSFAAPTIVDEGVNPANESVFSYDKAFSPYVELPIDSENSQEDSGKSWTFRYLDPKRSKTWKSNWKERAARLTEATETYSKAFLKRNSGSLFVDSPENDFCPDMSSKTTQTAGTSERVVVDLPKDDSCLPQDSLNYPKDNSYIPKDSSYCPKENSYLSKENSYIYARVNK